jgi:hypothetical protein
MVYNIAIVVLNNNYTDKTCTFDEQEFGCIIKYICSIQQLKPIVYVKMLNILNIIYI